jgi:hypothetical protein
MLGMTNIESIPYCGFLPERNESLPLQKGDLEGFGRLKPFEERGGFRGYSAHPQSE